MLVRSVGVGLLPNAFVVINHALVGYFFQTHNQTPTVSNDYFLLAPQFDQPADRLGAGEVRLLTCGLPRRACEGGRHLQASTAEQLPSPPDLDQPDPAQRFSGITAFNAAAPAAVMQ